MKKLDKEKTIERILKGTFPIELLEALEELDSVVYDIEEAQAGDEPGKADVYQVKKLIETAVTVVNVFRVKWGAYEGGLLYTPIDDQMELKLEDTETSNDAKVVHAESVKESE